jgi:ABC-type antimicrobial peptide transport system permease subunit
MPDWSDEIRQRLATLGLDPTRESDIVEELAQHLNDRYSELLAGGASDDEASTSARAELSDSLANELRKLAPEATKNPVVLGSGTSSNLLGGLWHDFRYGARMIRKNLGFTAVAVLTLALGIGANTAIFSLVDAFLWRLLPVKDPKQLVFVRAVEPKGRTIGTFPYPTFEQISDQNNSFSSIFARDDSRVSVTVDGEPEMVWGDFVSGAYFEMLGVRSIAGRTFTAADDQPGNVPVAVISYGYWDRRFGRDASAIGKNIYVGKIPFTIIGVTPPEFSGLNVAGGSAELTLPMFMQTQLALRDHNKFEIIARLKPDVTLEQAGAELDLIYKQLLTQAAGAQISSDKTAEIAAQRIELKPALRGYSASDDSFATELKILWAVAGLVLLISSVNVSALLLARSTSRQKEIAVRLSVGASRGRLVRQLLIESVLLASLGGALGLLFAVWGVDLFVRVLSYGQTSQILFGLRLNWSLLAFTGLVSILAGIVFGIAPAFASTRIDLNSMLKSSEGAAQSRRWHGGLMKSLIVSQLALSLALLIAAGLLVRTLRELNAVDTGFERERVLTMWTFPVLIGYDHAREVRLYGQLIDRLSATPGVQSASLSRFSLTRNAGPVGPRFFETMGITMLRGREFSSSDTETSPKVAVITETTARRFFPNEDPIGQHFKFQMGGGINIERLSGGGIEIVGLARDIKRSFRDQGRGDEGFYIPYTQAPPEWLGQAVLLVRTAANPASVVPLIRSEIQAVDQDLALLDIKTAAEEMEARYLSGEHSLAILLSFFTALALILASIGLYGTMSYSVERRTKEIGIRIALGAENRDMLWMVLRETLSLFAIGVAIGIPTAMAGSRLISSMLFGVSAADPVTILVAVSVMFAIAFAAGYLPARRATKVDPMVALRYE